MFLSVFTPTYNRAHVLDRLYESLCSQSCKNFEWIVVDDGSTDDTQNMIDRWIGEEHINIRYLKKENGGKPSAYNEGVSLACGELFLCVDSDDYLYPNTVETVLNRWIHDRNKSVNSFPVIGQIYYRVRKDGTPITVYNGSADYATLYGFYREFRGGGIPCLYSELI